MDKQPQVGGTLHLPISDTGRIQTLDICIRSHHNLNTVWINPERLDVILDSSMQLVRGISAAYLSLIKEPPLELNRIYVLAEVCPCSHQQVGKTLTI